MTQTVSITVNPPLATSSPSLSIAANNTTALPITGGVPFSGGVYSYSVSGSAGGSVSSMGLYSPAGTGSATITVKDSLGNSVSVSVTVNPAITISPTSYAMTSANTETFSASGGVSPYTYSVTGVAAGSMTGATYTPGAVGAATVTVTDSLGNTANSSVTVNAPLAISPTSYTMALNDTEAFTISGGVAPFSYSVTGTAGGSVTGGVYTPASTGSATVTVTDAIGNSVSSSVTVNAALSLSPISATMAVNDTKTFSATGGVSPYIYSVAGSAGGSMSGATYTPASTGSATVTVTDAIGNTSAPCSSGIGGAAGKAINLNSNTVTWSGGTQLSTVYGAVL